jgi:hypothetical protein
MNSRMQPGMNFSIFLQTFSLKLFLFFFLFLFSASAKAQKVESIYVNLYTDSLKKGTYNYINIEGNYLQANLFLSIPRI